MIVHFRLVDFDLTVLWVLNIDVPSGLDPHRSRLIQLRAVTLNAYGEISLNGNLPVLINCFEGKCRQNICSKALAATTIKRATASPRNQGRDAWCVLSSRLPLAHCHASEGLAEILDLAIALGCRPTPHRNRESDSETARPPCALSDPSSVLGEHGTRSTAAE